MSIMRFAHWKLLLLLALIPCGAFGQSGAADGDADADPGDAMQAEMVVTAEKREEPLRLTPQSVTALDARALEASGVENVKQASYYAPNLFVTGFAAKRTSFPYIRGIGSGQGDPAVTTYVDGVPQLSPNTTNIDFLDIQRVEILRGPQGTLYGRNTIGGLIHYISRQPDNQWRADLQFGLGDESYTRSRATVSGPIVKDRVLFSAGLALTERDGFSENGLTGATVDDRDGDFGRVQLLFTPNQSWRVRLNAFAQKDRDGGFTLYDLGGLRNQPYQVLQDFEGFTDRDLNGTSATVDYYGSSFDFTGIVAFDSWDADEASDLDFTPVDLLRRQVAEEQDQTYVELRLASHSPVSLSDRTSLQWVIGVSYFASDFDHASVNEFRPNLVQLPFALAETANYNLEDDGYGLFGQATVTFGENFDLIVGARLVREDKDTDLSVGSQLLPPPLDGQDAAFTEDFDEALPRLGLAYRIDDRTMVHANYAEGYRSGGYNRNTTPGGPFTLDPETSSSYEAGVKSALDDGRVFLAASAFSTDWEDMQLSVPNAFLPGRFYLDNVGEAQSRGLEFEITAQLEKRWSLSAALGLLDAEFEDYVDPNTVNPATGQGVNVSGNALPSMPDSNWSLALAHRSRVFGAYALTGRAEVLGVGDLEYDVANSEGQDAYSLANFRLGLERGGVRLELWVRNAFDEDYIPLAIPNFFSPSGWAGSVGEPRFFGVNVGYRY